MKCLPADWYFGARIPNASCIIRRIKSDSLNLINSSIIRLKSRSGMSNIWKYKVKAPLEIKIMKLFWCTPLCRDKCLCFLSCGKYCAKHPNNYDTWLQYQTRIGSVQTMCCSVRCFRTAKAFVSFLAINVTPGSKATWRIKNIESRAIIIIISYLPALSKHFVPRALFPQSCEDLHFCNQGSMLLQHHTSRLLFRKEDHRRYE